MIAEACGQSTAGQRVEMLDPIQAGTLQPVAVLLLQAESLQRPGCESDPRAVGGQDLLFVIAETAGGPGDAGMIGDGGARRQLHFPELSEQAGKQAGFAAGEMGGVADVEPKRAAAFGWKTPIDGDEGRVALAPGSRGLQELPITIGIGWMDDKAGNASSRFGAGHAGQQSGALGKRAKRSERLALFIRLAGRLRQAASYRRQSGALMPCPVDGEMRQP